jgi:hypothetical protein
MINEELDRMRDELDKIRDEALRDRFCELLWQACGYNKRRYLGWLETIAESRLPPSAMRLHLESILEYNRPVDAVSESEAARKARKAREREDAFMDGTP